MAMTGEELRSGSPAYMHTVQKNVGGADYVEVLDVQYEEVAQKQVVWGAIEAAEKARLRAFKVMVGTKDQVQVCDWNFLNPLMGQIWAYAAGCKHPYFKEEMEVRVVCYPMWEGRGLAPELKCGYRASRGRITRYYELPVGDGEHQPIKRIMLGPRNSFELSDVEKVVAESGYDIKRIRFSKSKGPYC